MPSTTATFLDKTNELQDLLNAMEKAEEDASDHETNAEAARDSARVARDQAEEAVNDIGKLGGIDGTVRSTSDLPSSDGDGEFYYVINKNDYYEDTGNGSVQGGWEKAGIPLATTNGTNTFSGKQTIEQGVKVKGTKDTPTEGVEITDTNDLTRLTIYSAGSASVAMQRESVVAFRDPNGNNEWRWLAGPKFEWGPDNSTSADPVHTITRTVENTSNQNAHAWVDQTTVQRDGDIGFASYDSQIDVKGAFGYDHVVGFQARPDYQADGQMGRLTGFHTGYIHSGTGTISNVAGFWARDINGTGPVTNQYGLWVKELTRGGTNYAVYTEGSTPSLFEGPISAGGGTPTSTWPLQSKGNFRVRTAGGGDMTIEDFGSGSALMRSASTLGLAADGGTHRLMDGNQNDLMRVDTGKVLMPNTLKHTGSDVGFFGTTPASKVAITDNTGGGTDGTLAAVSGSGADGAINDNFAEIYNALSTYGLI